MQCGPSLYLRNQNLVHANDINHTYWMHIGCELMTVHVSQRLPFEAQLLELAAHKTTRDR